MIKRAKLTVFSGWVYSNWKFLRVYAHFIDVTKDAQISLILEFIKLISG
jgi:hypothetical protein